MKRLGLLLCLFFPILAGATEGPKLTCDAPVYQFGRVDQSAVVTNVFTVRNDGDTTFVAGRPRTTCGCTRASLSKPMIGPGETAELTAVFAARRRAGEQKRAIRLPPSDSDDPAITFYMQGFVEPATKSR